MKVRLITIINLALLAVISLIIAGCETENNLYQNDNLVQNDQLGIWNGDGSDDLKEKISNFQAATTCRSDEDCILFDNGLKENACWSCESIDYSQDSWVGANEASYDEFSSVLNEYRQKSCGPMPGCPITITNINYQAKCVDNACKKVDVDEQETDNLECAQENYGNEDYCAGLSEGTNVPSCDCNGCSCIKMADGKLYPTCTERGCGTGKTWPYN